MRSREDSGSEAWYRIRFLACLATSMLLTILVVRMWPSYLRHAPHSANQSSVIESIHVEEVQPTQQPGGAPAPDRPPIPVLAQVDQELPEDRLDISEGHIDVNDNSEHLTVGDGEAPSAEEGSVVASPPRVLRMVEPRYPEEARRNRIEAEISVRVLVGDDGEVLEAQIEDVLELSDAANQRSVGPIRLGLEEAALHAARQWSFLPAYRNGTPVATHTVVTFRFGH